MRRRSDLSGSRLAATLVACALAACGTLASPSGGDVDLPLSFVGPFQSLEMSQTPAGQSTLIAPDLDADVDEPSVIVVGERRVAFMTLTPRDPQGGPRTVIARAAERTNRPPRSLDFESALPFFMPELSWEQGAVASPSVVAAGPTDFVMAYAAGGAIGLARSSDGRTFQRRAEPILTADTTRGEGLALAQPSLARAPDGRWYLAYASEGRIFVARAAAPEGPWERVGRGPVLEPAADRDAGTTTSPDAGLGFESRALSDPALAIYITPAGRALFALFYTADGGTGITTVGAAASYDGALYRRVGRAVYSERNTAVRAGSLELVDERTALLWVGTASGRRRVITAAIGPVIPRSPTPSR